MAIESPASTTPTAPASQAASIKLNSELTINRPVSSYVGLPPWTDKNEQALLQPYNYIIGIPGKDLRTQLLRAFNAWYGLPEATFNVISECVAMLHNASLLFDDIEDFTELRRGQPVAHRVYGLPQTINTAAYAMFVAMSKLYTITGIEASTYQTLFDIFLEEITELHRGQGLEIYWRDTLTCPTEDEYFCMIKQKTGGLFRLGVRLMAACSPNGTHVDATRVVDLFSVFFQARDDVMNLDSGEYAAQKGFAEDLTEGKFSFPVVHSITTSRARGEHADAEELLSNLGLHTTSDALKRRMILHMHEKTDSLTYARAVIDDLESKMHEEIARLGGNPGLEGVVGKLSLRGVKG